MMKSPEEWPNWPLLPIKRWKDHQLETGVLYASKPMMFLRGANMWHLEGYDRSKAVEADLEALVADGWVVD